MANPMAGTAKAPGTRISTRRLSSALLLLNLVSIVLGVIYFYRPGGPLFMHIFGSILLPAWMGNALLAYLNSKQTTSNGENHRIPDILSTVYLTITIIAMAGMFAGSFLISSAYSEAFVDNIIWYLLLYTGLFSTLALGAALAYFNLRPAAMNLNTSPRKAPGVWAVAIVKAVLYLLLSFGIYICFVLLVASTIQGFLELLVSQFALYFAFIMLSASLLLEKLHRRDKRQKLASLTGLMGIALFIILLLPSISMPFARAKAEKEFTVAFGSNLEGRIAPSVQKHFSQIPFSLPAYFLGIPSGGYLVEKDILYYEGTSGVDQGLLLYFDAYLPPENSGDLPGNNSVLIRIHGGGWQSGGKGLRNMMQMNKYFAAQGYVVFDVQYGLSTLAGERGGIMSAPDHVMGPFTADDMVRHLGVFTQYLEENADKFSANLDSVFISGGSAGGHLATALALGINSEAYPELFSEALTIKGIIPFYPGYRHSILTEIGGSAHWLDVEMLVNSESPPCLIFHGTHDAIVPPKISNSFQDRYRAAGTEECAVLWMPLAGHAADLGFSGYYNQLFVYYMERFMAAYR